MSAREKFDAAIAAARATEAVHLDARERLIRSAVAVRGARSVSERAEARAEYNDAISAEIAASNAKVMAWDAVLAATSGAADEMKGG